MKRSFFLKILFGVIAVLVSSIEYQANTYELNKKEEKADIQYYEVKNAFASDGVFHRDIIQKLPQAIVTQRNLQPTEIAAESINYFYLPSEPLNIFIFINKDSVDLDDFAKNTAVMLEFEKYYRVLPKEYKKSETGKTIKLSFELKESVLDPIIALNFVEVNNWKEFTSESKKTIKLNQSILIFNRENNLLIVYSTYVIYGMIGFLVFLYIFWGFKSESLSYVWYLVDFTQEFALIFYLDIFYPENIVNFLSNINFYFLVEFMPDPGKTNEPFPKSDGMYYKFFGQDIKVNNKVPKKFLDHNKCGNFLVDSLNIIIILVGSIFLVFLTKFMKFCFKKSDKLESIFTEILTWIEYSAVIRIFQVLFIPILIGLIIQFSDWEKTNEFTGLLSVIISFFIALLIIALFVFFFYSTLDLNLVFGFSDEHFKKFGGLLLNFNIFSIFQRTCFLLMIVKKAILVLLLFESYHKITLMVDVFMLIELLFLIYIVQVKPWQYQIISVMEMIKHLSLIVIFFCVKMFTDIDLFTDRNGFSTVMSISERERKNELGLIILAIFFATFTLYFFIILIKYIKEIFEKKLDILSYLKSKNLECLVSFVNTVLCIYDKELLVKNTQKKKKKDGANIETVKKVNFTKDTIKPEEKFASAVQVKKEKI